MSSGLKFRHKMVLPAAAVVAAALVATGVSAALSSRASQELTRVEREHAPALEVSRDLEELLARLQGQLRDSAGAEDLAGLELADGLHAEMGRRIELAEAAGLEEEQAERLHGQVDEYYQLARHTTERLIRRDKGEVVVAATQAMAGRFRALGGELADRTARARASMATGFEAARRLQARSAALGALIMILAAVGATAFSWWLAAGLSRPLETLHRAALRIAEGDLTVPIEVTSGDEVGALAGAFLRMTGRLREIIATLGTASGDLSGAAVELDQLTRAQTALLERQATGIAQTSTTTRQLEQTSALASSRATSVLDVARRAADFSLQGQGSAQQSVEGIRQIQDSVGRIVAQSTLLLDQARAVGEIVETVKDLATQSHVLSLNASIEAVRAGEAGKGFGVVAAEVRALAEQSGQAAARIGRMVQEIQAAIQATLDLTERSRRGMEGSLDAIRASGQSLTHIGAIVKETSEAALQIATAVQQQSTGVGQIAGAMRDLDAGMEETLARIQGLEQAAAHLKATSVRISEIVSGFRVE
ncbi:MAG: methyl-accepting chemotaxis protein [Anaeromyxobacter sp.]|nr:methyl-accepting chemotaxis protein [Anaeromyxobacter sp.]MBL0277488.1 methyl-accepting chemotaxis protein [Anaeromyxobacter sp.]